MLAGGGRSPPNAPASPPPAAVPHTAEDFAAAYLQAIADGPIMNPNAIYLPAGRLSQAEYERRLREQFRDAGIAR